MVERGFPMVEAMLAFREAWRTRAAALLALTLCLVPFSIGAHLIAEIAGLGLQSGVAVAFAERHLYFAVLLAAVAASMWALRRFVPAGRRLAVARAAVAALPFGGRGGGFAAATFSLQLLFFVATQAVEGDPLAKGNLALALTVAVVVSAAVSFVFSSFERPLVEIVLGFAWIGPDQHGPDSFVLPRRPPARRVRRRGALLSSLSNRPPPFSPAH